MPRKIDTSVKEQVQRLLAGHRQNYSSATALAVAVPTKLGLGRETVRRWHIQADVNAGTGAGVTSDDNAELKRLKAEQGAVLQQRDPAGSNGFLRRGTPSPQPLLVARRRQSSRGDAVESICQS